MYPPYHCGMFHLFYCSSCGGVDEDEGGGPQLDHHQHQQEQFLLKLTLIKASYLNKGSLPV